MSAWSWRTLLVAGGLFVLCSSETFAQGICPISLAKPPGATAQCNDGTWSMSQNRQGTCSSHNGVACWVCPGPLCDVSQCTYAISPTSTAFSSNGGNGVVTVTSTCGWSATSNSSFVTILSGSSGIGNGTVTFAVAPNPLAARTAVLTIANRSFTITQASGCSFGVNFPTRSFSRFGGTAAGTITATNGCPWTASSDSSWLTVASGTSGAGNGGVSVSVAPNYSPFSRSGALTIAGQVVNVTQEPTLILRTGSTDFDGDGRSDPGVYRHSSGQWLIAPSGGGSIAVAWGAPELGDTPVTGDYDGDGKSDIGVFRGSTGEWLIIRSSDSTLLSVAWGVVALGDIPVPADYDADGRTDVAVYRTTTGEWFVIRSSNSTLLSVGWGAPSLGDVPVVGDYDGDGRADVAVYRLSSGEWFIIRSSNSTLLQVGWGVAALGDIPVVGDYDNDGKSDVAVYRQTTGEWFVIRSSNSSLLQVGWGSPAAGDLPVAADYDGDGRTDVGVFRTSTGDWFIIRSADSTLLPLSWGTPVLGDLPVGYP